MDPRGYRVTAGPDVYQLFRTFARWGIILRMDGETVVAQRMTDTEPPESLIQNLRDAREDILLALLAEDPEEEECIFCGRRFWIPTGAKSEIRRCAVCFPKPASSEERSA